MPAPDPDTRAHLEWLGFIQPSGLVVSAPALVKAGAILNRRDADGQSLLTACVRERTLDPALGPEPCLPDFREFAAAVLGWGFSPRGYAGTEEAPIPPELELPLPDYGETLRPRFAVRERDPGDGQTPWQLLVQVLHPGQDFDAPATATATASGDGGAGGSPGSGSGGGLRRLEASPHGRIERLLRGVGVSAGLLFNGAALRLVSAPRGESSGWMDFRVADMSRPAGRPLCSALRLLLSEQRLLALPRGQRLAALLADSRNYQNEVSERLSEQVMHALYELLRGLQAAHDASRGALLREPLSPGGDRDDVYRALLAVILRLVFLLYAEERGVLPEDETFARHYSLAGLYRRLREDAALHPDTMDQRFGAWAQLLVLFRLVHDGAPAWRTGGALHLPERLGALFDPDRFPFLEGRYAVAGARQTTERVRPPLVSDGAVHRVLEKLFVLDGERISYRTLDVEQIGSVYETIMGFRMEVATGPSVAVKPAKKLGAPSTIDLEALLAEPAGARARWLRAHADRNVTDAVAKGLRAARTVDDLHAALDRVLDKDAAPDLVPPGALVLQPNEERRRSGSHYTPRALTEPIVRHALAPVLDRLRGDGHNRAPPTPAQILDLKVCDPAMGSGAFLVEACRQLADALIEAWGAHGEMPAIPPDEDEVIHARRLVAQRCLYGIDRNPTAVDLAKVSLWLSTLARDHPLTFVDHAFRHGDSLVGLTRRQIEAFHWLPDTRPLQAGFEAMRVREHVAKAAALRRRIREAGEEVSDRELHDLWRDADDETGEARLFGDLALAAFFAEAKPKQREALRRQIADAVVRGEQHRYRSWIEELRDGSPPLAPFHWEIEFPEVFDRENPGFDAFVGNPPFAGKNALAAGNVAHYPDWLKTLHEGSHGNADLVAHFYRRAFGLLREGGALGLIATNTIAQGDTRSSGLRWICEHGGEIYRATRRVKWPGEAAVVVSVLHVAKASGSGEAGRKTAGGPGNAGVPPALTAPAASDPSFPRKQESMLPGGAPFPERTARFDAWPRVGQGETALDAGGQAPDPDGADDGVGADPGYPTHRASPEGGYAGRKAPDDADLPARRARPEGGEAQSETARGPGNGASDDAGVPPAGTAATDQDSAFTPGNAGVLGRNARPALAAPAASDPSFPRKRESMRPGSASDPGRTARFDAWPRAGQGETALDADGQAPDPGGADDGAGAAPGYSTFRTRPEEGYTRNRTLDDADLPAHRRQPGGGYAGNKVLDGAIVDTITAFLFHQGGHADPARLVANAGKSFVGSYVLGMGFTFDDTDKKGVASPLADMRRLVEDNPRNQDAIFPYIGGEEVNTSPTHAHRRYVINFRDWPLRREDIGESWADADEERRRELRRQPIVPHDYPEPVAADWPDLLAIVEERVKPERMKLGDNGDAKRRKEKYWLWGRYTPSLFAATAGLERVLAVSRVGQQAAFVFLPKDMVYAESMIIFPFTAHSAFCALQSRPHEIWARFFGSSMKDDLRYTPSDCFETFPFPEEWEAHPALEAAGRVYYDFRADLMVRNDEGLTRTYNRFHDPYENDPDVAQLRALHAALDRAVLDAYGWSDVPTDCDFLLDHEIDEAAWGHKKKPYRYRWPDPIRDEVLARLLALNAARAAAEARAGTADLPRGPSTPPERPRPRQTPALHPQGRGPDTPPASPDD